MRMLRFVSLFIVGFLFLINGINGARATSGALLFSDKAEIETITDTWTIIPGYAFGPGNEYGVAKVHSGARAIAVDGAVGVTFDNLNDKTFEMWMYDDLSTSTNRSAINVQNYMEIGEFGTGYCLYLGVIDNGAFGMQYALWLNGDPRGYIFPVDRTLGWHKFAIYLDHTGTGYQAYIDGVRIHHGELVLGFNGQTGFYLGAYASTQDGAQTYFDDVTVTSGNTYETPSGNCSWTRRADMPTARFANAAGTAIVNGKITVVGHHEGNPGSGRINEEYDPATDTWASKEPYPRGDGRIGLNKNAVVGNEIYFIGGANVWNNYHTQTVDKYNPVTDTWTTDVAVYPVPVENLGTVAFGDKLYCFGGNDYAGPSYQLSYRFDPSTSQFTRLNDMPIGRVVATPVVMGDKIWIVGGIDYPNSTPIHTRIDIYDPASDNWTEGPNLPRADSYLYWAGVLADGALYAVYDDSTPVVFRFDESAGKWEMLCSAPLSNLMGYGVAGIGREIHVFGGGDPKTGLHQAVTIAAANTAPTAKICTVAETPVGSSCSASIPLNGTCSSDPDGDTLTYTWTGPFGTASGPTPTVTLPKGTHTITLTVDDGHGGTATDSTVVTVVDRTPPIFTIVPGPITVEQTGPSGSIVTVPQASATDNCGSVTITNNAPPIFPLGTTTVTFTATDGSGNSTTATTTVKVVRMLTALDPVKVWIGLKNSDDVGTRFDLLAEAFRNGMLVGSGELRNVPGGSSGFNNAKPYTIPLVLSAKVPFDTGDTLSIKVSVRVAVESSHRSGTARLWFSDAVADSHFAATVGTVNNNLYLLSGFSLGLAAGPGPRVTSDVTVDRARDGNAYKAFGTWGRII